MQFGIFGGAKINTDAAAGDVGMAGDSVGLAHYIKYVLAAERLGFSHVFMVEHHFTGVEQVSSSLSLLNYLAAKTQRIRLGTAVIVLPWHNPALLAEQVATLDVLSGGRFDFGVGKGYRPTEFEGFGVAPAEAQSRFDETLGFLKQAWTARERFTHRGPHWVFNNIVVEPSPVQRPHPPIWMGAGSPDSIRRAAAEGVNLLLDQVGAIDLTMQRVAIYREERARLGLPQDGAQIAATRGLWIVDTEAERQAALDQHAAALERAGALKLGNLAGSEGRETYRNSDAPLIGTPEQISAQIAALQAGGLEILLFADIRASVATLERFAAEVMPRFQSRPVTVGA
jgi:alkanesulfonate monooxygenase SsuD/methylene tetrahydromethanopterin reductase-like flavin-dependent oxidoreductase (luciferase family)